MNKVEELETILQSPCWVIDLLPEQVPANAGGQYFAIEKYWRKEPQRTGLRQKQLHLILKLNCYLDVRVWDGPTNPAPETFAELIGQERLLLALGDALLVAEPDDTYLTVYNPDERLLELLKTLAVSEGLFLWQPPQANDAAAELHSGS